MIIQDYDSYLEQLNEKIKTQRLKKRNSLYEMDVEFSSIDKRNEICSRIKEHFSNLKYGIQIDYCQSCGGRKADIIILIPPVVE